MASKHEEVSEDIDTEDEMATRSQPLSPVIGVLCMDQSTSLVDLQPDATCYLAASNVAYLQQAGAKVVPIWLARDSSYYDTILGKVNGVLLPGGAVFLPYEQHSKLRSDCVAAAEHIYKAAVKLNDSGQYFPLWGICLGMELMMHHDSHGAMTRLPLVQDIRQSRPLQLTADHRKSRLFADVSEEMHELLATTKVAHHYHRYCITRQTLREGRIQDDWWVLAESEAETGPFITMAEHRRHPFYAFQFHPERVGHERYAAAQDRYDHSEDACRAAGYFAQFFVDECRKSKHRFGCPAEEQRHLIENFPLTECPAGKHWRAVYLFSDNQQYS